MKRYIRANDNNSMLRKLGITSQEFEAIKKWCDNYDPDSSLGFESDNGMWVTNIFLDDSGRFELSLAEAVNTYGLANIKKFCQQVLAQADTNQICDIEDDGKYTTFFLYTPESGYWYWAVDTPVVRKYRGSMEEFVADEDNYNLGSSTAYFNTLQEAKEDYNSLF